MTSDELHQLFAKERARFAEVFPHVAGTRLYVARRKCSLPDRCAVRDLAYATTGGTRPSITILSRALRLPRRNLLGIVRHELGHIADRWVHRAGREQRADDLAEFVTGVPIRYDPRDIQTVGAGTYPRPLYLHR